jgi:hypothetical protein
MDDCSRPSVQPHRGLSGRRNLAIASSTVY